MKTTYHGSCHCGAVRYQAEMDLSAGTTRCNCTYCTKTRYWGAHVQPYEFTLLAGEEALSDYCKSEAGHHRFCRHCGAHAFGHGDIPEMNGPYYSVNIACLDGLAPEERAAIPVEYLDGLHDNWWNPPAVSSYL